MQLKTILNRVQKYQSFIYTDVELNECNNQLELNIAIRARRNSRHVVRFLNGVRKDLRR